MDSRQLRDKYKAGERNFRDLALIGVNLVWFELPNIDLRGADLSRANLSGANLSEANLSNYTNLSFADLSRANLSNANLKGANLEGANLAGAVLEGAVYDATTKFPMGFDPAKIGAIPIGEIPHKDAEPPNIQEDEAILPQQTEQLSFIELEQYSIEQPPQARGKKKKRSQAQSLNSRKITPVKPLRSIQNSELLEQSTIPLPTNPRSSSDWQDIQSMHWTSAPSQQHRPTDEDGLNSAEAEAQIKISLEDIKAWNWGAFLLPWVWFFTNRQFWNGIWLCILTFFPLVGPWIVLIYAIIMGKKGNEWAWESREWESLETFKKYQLGCAIAGFMVWGAVLFFVLIFKK